MKNRRGWRGGRGGSYGGDRRTTEARRAAGGAAVAGSSRGRIWSNDLPLRIWIDGLRNDRTASVARALFGSICAYCFWSSGSELWPNSHWAPYKWSNYRKERAQKLLFLYNCPQKNHIINIAGIFFNRTSKHTFPTIDWLIYICVWKIPALVSFVPIYDVKHHGVVLWTELSLLICKRKIARYRFM